MAENIIAVIGAGTIGADVALDLAINKFTIMLKDLSDDMLGKATERIKNNYRFTKMMKRNKSLPPLDEVMERITPITDYKNFQEVDLVIENITENYKAKKRLYLELKEVCRDNVIFGVNTSCISITKIGALTPNPENVIGIHFMNPVPLSKLVEVVKGFHTSDETVERIKSFITNLNKTCIVVKDLPGFVTNRVLMLMINECIWLVHDQVAKPKEVDIIFKLGFGHKMGPLATADLIGLDTILNSLSVLYEDFNDPKYRACPLLKKMVHAGLLGRKSGKGFFEY